MYTVIEIASYIYNRYFKENNEKIPEIKLHRCSTSRR